MEGLDRFVASAPLAQAAESEDSPGDHLGQIQSFISRNSMGVLATAEFAMLATLTAVTHRDLTPALRIVTELGAKTSEGSLAKEGTEFLFERRADQEIQTAEIRSFIEEARDPLDHHVDAAAVLKQSARDLSAGDIEIKSPDGSSRIFSNGTIIERNKLDQVEEVHPDATQITGQEIEVRRHRGSIQYVMDPNEHYMDEPGNWNLYGRNGYRAIAGNFDVTPKGLITFTKPDGRLHLAYTTDATKYEHFGDSQWEITARSGEKKQFDGYITARDGLLYVLPKDGVLEARTASGVHVVDSASAKSETLEKMQSGN